MKKSDAVVSLGLIALGAGAYYTAYTEYSEGTQYSPMIYSAGLIILSLILLFTSFHRKKDEEQAPAQSVGRLLTVLGMIAAYIALINYAGFYVSTLAFLLVFMLVMRATSSVKAVLISVIVTGLLYFFFSRVLLIPTPHGMFI